jgi:hypothetical protein
MQPFLGRAIVARAGRFPCAICLYRLPRFCNAGVVGSAGEILNAVAAGTLPLAETPWHAAQYSENICLPLSVEASALYLRLLCYRLR